MRDQALRPVSAGAKLTVDDDGDSVVSGYLGPVKPTIKAAWQEKNEKVNYDSFHRMLDEYREAKRREGQLDLKTKQLAAQLARTEEAAKRALVQTDVTAKGGAAQKLLDAERALFKMRDENAELRSKLSRANKRASELKVAHDENKKRLDAALKDQRLMARKVGDLERKNKSLVRRPEDEYWGEEAGRRFVVQQEELVLVHEENMRLKKQLAQAGISQGVGKAAAAAGGGADTSVFTAQIEELSSLVRFYEKKVSTMAERLATGGGGGGAKAGPGPDDWVLEELSHDGSLFLVDPKTQKMFTVPSGSNSYPRPVGMHLPNGIKLGSSNRMDRFICTLDSYCQASKQKLDSVFRSFDTSGDGVLDRGELGVFLLQLMPDMEPNQVEVVRCLMDLDGDGQVSLPELVAAIKEVFAARSAAKIGKSIEVNEVLGNVRDALQLQQGLVKDTFASMDKDQDGCLTHLDVVRLVKKLVPGVSQREVRYLLTKILEWDLAGAGKASLDDIYQAMELVRVYRPSQTACVGGGRPRAAAGAGAGAGMSPYETADLLDAPVRASGVVPMTARAASAGMLASPAKFGAAKIGAGAQLQRDAYMKDRLAQLEAELDSAHTREGALEADAKRVEVMRRDLAIAKARIEDLEKDYMKLDVLNHLSEAGGEDSKLQAAWETASQFKKRYMEHKAELDTIRLAAARMQSQLEETHKLLHEEHRKRFRLEDENTRLGMETARIKDLEALLNKERVERLNLEREYMGLQNKALSAPGQALGELRQLQDEVFALRREKAVAEAKEVDVRRELSSVRQQLDGMSMDQYKNWQRDNGDLKKQVIQLQHEVSAAREKLDVYRQTDEAPSRISGLLDAQQQQQQQAREEQQEYGLFGAGAGSWSSQVPVSCNRRPDANKTEEEMRLELGQLREVWNADQQELKKLHKVLAVESGQTLEAKAALEETHKEMDRLRRDLQEQMYGMKRELDRKDERIRKLELQLRGAYSGVNRALRSSHMRESRSTNAPDDLSELGPNQNILELHISDASLQEDVLGKDPSTFFTFDFFMHDTQATPVVASSKPQFNTLVQYVVDNDPFLLEYLDTHVLELELNRARGWDYDAVGVARLPLRQVLEDLEVGAALGQHHAYHYAEVFGADGQRVGRVRYGFTFRRPLDNLLREFKSQVHSLRSSEPDPRDPATTAVALALSDPSTASHIKAIITRCEQLVLPGGMGAPARPYVWYRFPGHRDAHTTRAEHGPNPLFSDEALWLISRTPALEASLRTRLLELTVFDDAGGEDPMQAIVGVAQVPMGALAQGLPVEGTFGLVHPVSKQPAGAVVLGLAWANPLTLGRATTAAGVSSSCRPSAGMGAMQAGAGPSLMRPAVFGQDVDTGLAGFEGEELREVSRTQPPQHGVSSGLPHHPQPVVQQHQKGFITHQGMGMTSGMPGTHDVGPGVAQQGMGMGRGRGMQGAQDAYLQGQSSLQQQGLSGMEAHPQGQVGWQQHGPGLAPGGYQAGGVGLFEQQNLQAQQMLEEQVYLRRLQQQQQQELRGGGGGSQGSSASHAAQQPRGSFEQAGGVTGLSARPGGQADLTLGAPAAGGLVPQPLIQPDAARTHQHLLQPQHPSHRGFQQQPLQPAHAGHVAAPDIMAGGAAAIPPRVPSNRFGVPTSDGGGLGLSPAAYSGPASYNSQEAIGINQGHSQAHAAFNQGSAAKPYAADPYGPMGWTGAHWAPDQHQRQLESPQTQGYGLAQEFGLASEMRSPAPSLAPAGGAGGVSMLFSQPAAAGLGGARGRYASAGGRLSPDSMSPVHMPQVAGSDLSFSSGTPAPAPRPLQHGLHAEFQSRRM